MRNAMSLSANGWAWRAWVMVTLGDFRWLARDARRPGNPTARATASVPDQLRIELSRALGVIGSNCQDLWMGAAPTQR